jgi:hypothetical protein
MQFPIDHFHKRLHGVVFSGLGRIETEVEVAVDTQRIDTRFQPAPGGGPPPAELGVFGRVAGSPVIIESYSKPPSFDELRDCVRKLLAAHHLDVLRTRRARRLDRRRHGEPRDIGRSSPRAPPPEIPVLWITSAGRPDGAIEAFAFQPLQGWPHGVYAGPQTAIPVRLVLVNELPTHRETLALRLLGRGATRQHAMAELADLPEDSWEQHHLVPLLVELEKKLLNARETRTLTKDEQEILVDGQKLVAEIKNQGRAEGRSEGRAEGVMAGLAPLVRLFTRKLGRPLTERERKTLVRRLDTLGPDRLGDVAVDLDGPALATWLANTRAR